MITDVVRRGKCPVFMFGTDRTPLVSRLGMSGYWDFEDDPWTFNYVEGARKSTGSDVRVKLELDDGSILRYHDARMFGRLEFMAIPEMGPEPVWTPRSWAFHYGQSHLMTESQFVNLIRERGSNYQIKDFLMQQHLLAGIGNIYSSEACHLAKVKPTSLAMVLRPQAVQMLWRAIQSVLTANLGEISYQWLRVYRRHACECGTKISRIVIAKRATFFCPACQFHCEPNCPFHQ